MGPHGPGIPQGSQLFHALRLDQVVHFSAVGATSYGSQDVPAAAGHDAVFLVDGLENQRTVGSLASTSPGSIPRTRCRQARPLMSCHPGPDRAASGEESARRLLQEGAARQAAEASVEAQKAREEERRHRSQLHVTLSSIGDTVNVTGVNGAVTFMNPVAVALTGWEASDIAGEPERMAADQTRPRS